MKYLKSWFIFIASVIALILEVIIVPTETNIQSKINYYLYMCVGICVISLILAIVSYLNENFRKILQFKSLFFTGIVIFIALYNIVTTKLNLIPTIYFPPTSKILGVLIEDRTLILKCLAYSSRLLTVGFFGGALVGIVTGIAIGFNKKVSYWINPLVKFLGPIPSTAWVPLVLVVFPDTISASSFLIAFAVWFPTTVMTSSGISNVSNSFFEVSETLGASTLYKIFKVGVPSAMPSIFIGLFNGICSAFITLMTAEMIGAKYGIGWYVNWQKEMMCYSNVYAGLIIIAITCSVLITILFKVKDKLLVWQKGVIKW